MIGVHPARDAQQPLTVELAERESVFAVLDERRQIRMREVVAEREFSVEMRRILVGCIGLKLISMSALRRWGRMNASESGSRRSSSART